MSSLIEHITGLEIGAVESVSSREIKIQLNLEAPQGAALNTSTPQPFPQVSGYVLIPTAAGSLVGIIEWVGVERSPFPKRTGLRDFGLIDLPYPLRKIVVNPVGTLKRKHAGTPGSFIVEFRRGVTTFPSIGDSALLPGVAELRAIVEAHGSNRRVAIGISPNAAGAPVTVDPDKIFGRHLAVLGNTGSGKSCSLAGLVRWSLDAAKRSAVDPRWAASPNARFIFLDPNGEYAKAFADLDKTVRVFRVAPPDGASHSLILPAWIWNSHEWASFTSASPGAQRPILLKALRDLKSGEVVEDEWPSKIRRRLRTCQWELDVLQSKGTSGYTGFPGSKNCGDLIERLRDDVVTYGENTAGETQNSLRELFKSIDRLIKSRRWENKNGSGYNNFSETDLGALQKALQDTLDIIPQMDTAPTANEDAPIPFDLTELPDYLQQLAGDVAGAGQWIALLAMRVRMMLADRRLGPILNPNEQPDFHEWLGDHVSTAESKTGQITILDLSLVPSDVLHIVIAVIGRVIFEALQRARRLVGVELPTVLVLEEAHNFVRRGNVTGGDGVDYSPATICRQTFERVAREGRKFGLGLVLSSQRPAELSPTVLAQCNTFLLHRIVNDRDQELVKKLVPDNLGGLLGELPNLATQHAILLGWGVALPTLVRLETLPEEQRPRSSDPEFWATWTGRKEVSVDWEKVAEEWTGDEG